MKRHDVFTFKAPDGTEVIGGCVDIMRSFYEQGVWYVTYLCYGQHKLFTLKEERSMMSVSVGIDEFGDDIIEEQESVTCVYGETLVDYCILPDYDSQLEDYQHKLDMADDYASREL